MKTLTSILPYTVVVVAAFLAGHSAAAEQKTHWIFKHPGQIESTLYPNPVIPAPTPIAKPFAPQQFPNLLECGIVVPNQTYTLECPGSSKCLLSRNETRGFCVVKPLSKYRKPMKLLLKTTAKDMYVCNGSAKKWMPCLTDMVCVKGFLPLRGYGMCVPTPDECTPGGRIRCDKYYPTTTSDWDEED